MLRSVSEKSYDQPQFETPTNNKGKRKADQVDVTPPDQRTSHHATFVIPTDGRRECPFFPLFRRRPGVCARRADSLVVMQARSMCRR